MIGSLPTAPPFRLVRHQLAQVLCQVRFSPILRLRQDEAIIPFQEAIRAEYPRYLKAEGMGILITPAGVQSQPSGSPIHRFQDVHGRYTVALSDSFVALESSDYADVDDFAERLTGIGLIVQSEFEPAEISRVGLRFINELRLPTSNPKAEIVAAVTPILLGAAGTSEFLEAMLSVQQALHLAITDGQMLVRHGFHPNGGTTVDSLGGQVNPPPQNDLAQPFYLLDLDAYLDGSSPYTVERIEDLLRSFNEDIRSFFAWAINEEYRRSNLGQVDEGV
jgi:uncharacterized protein (TIGR04255 family)